MRDPEQWTYKLNDIADASGATLNAVRDCKQDGRLKPDSLLSVAVFVISRRLKELFNGNKDS